MENLLEKVSAFITREGAQARELLLFGHPSAGIQVPAGTVEEGETVEQAVLREVLEETGLKDVTITRKLGEQVRTMHDSGRSMLTQGTLLFKAPASSSASTDTWLGRGWPVIIQRQLNDWSEIIYEELDLNANPTVVTRYSGWLPTSLLATRVVRHFFHLETTTPAPDAWEHVAEDRYTFRFYWVPLVPRPFLVKGQDEWLEQVYSALI